jgi:hypothetical protein
MLKKAFKIGLTREEFLALTPHEFILACEAYNERIEDQLRLEAWNVHHIIKFVTGEDVSIDTLMGKEELPTDLESFKEYMRRKEGVEE